jgi:hypothetical protein
MTDYDNQLAHLIKLAKTPGWKQYAWQRALELDRDNTGLWLGIAEALKQAMLASKAAESAA